jgi:hypothetical protein
MNKFCRGSRDDWRGWALAAAWLVVPAGIAAQQPSPAATPPATTSPAAQAPGSASPASTPAPSAVWPPSSDQDKATPPKTEDQPAAEQAPAEQAPAEKSKGETHITPEEAKQLFGLVDELIKFSSDESGLAIKSDVKRQMTSRGAVESYLKEKFNEDEGAKRLQRGEIVLEKFGLLDRDFALKPFLLALLKEQIEAYYDSKSKTVYMLDWVSVDEQKPVLAHELTHALQDQRIDLEKWGDQTPDEVSQNYREAKPSPKARLRR